MRKMLLVVAASILWPCPAGWTADTPQHRRLSAVPFTQVKLRDQFWSPRLKTNRESSLPHNFQWCEQTGRISNFAKAAGLQQGKFEGIYFNDSDVYKVLEGAAYALADQPDANLERTVDGVIAKMAAAQQPDGYLNTYYTLVEKGKRFTNLAVMHELYCAGHLFEGAVAHFRATGKRTLLDVATKYADHIDSVFGPDKRHDVCGHEEIELALVKLYQATGEERYFRLAKFFLDMRGNEAERKKLYGPYCQDHEPVRKQREIVGHAVRAMYLYSGVADVAGYTGDQQLIEAMRRLWDDVVRHKMYITGGIGARHAGEAFGDAYELPNESAYCETCAAIGLALWAHRLNLMHADAHYADVLERVIYNGILSGIGMDGKLFFYVNPLASNGGHHRQPFFSCACCPSNVVRFVPSVPGYLYAVADGIVYVNLYAASTSQVKVGPASVRIVQDTTYPWEGKVALKVESEQPAEFALCLRIPEWCDAARLSVAGQPVNKIETERGYVRVRRSWRAGDVVELNLPMPVRRMEAHPRVAANLGRVAVQRGPLVYCFEAVDNSLRPASIILPRDPQFTAVHKPELLGGVTIVQGVERAGKPITAVPYYAWDHRAPGGMLVWARQEGKSRAPGADDPAWQGRLYRPLDPATLGAAETPTPAELATPSASHCHGPDAVTALNDRLEPANSCDHSIARFTWWDHRGTKEWAQYDFDAPRKVSAVAVYWFDDARLKRHCRAPQSWKLLHKAGDAWQPVAGATEYGTAVDRFNRVTFDPVETTALRIEVQLQPEFSGGILEWKLE
jgi:DUF1680 family protein